MSHWHTTKVDCTVHRIKHSQLTPVNIRTTLQSSRFIGVVANFSIKQWLDSCFPKVIRQTIILYSIFKSTTFNLFLFRTLPIASMLILSLSSALLHYQRGNTTIRVVVHPWKFSTKNFCCHHPPSGITRHQRDIISQYPEFKMFEPDFIKAIHKMKITAERMNLCSTNLSQNSRPCSLDHCRCIRWWSSDATRLDSVLLRIVAATSKI